MMLLWMLNEPEMEERKKGRNKEGRKEGRNKEGGTEEREGGEEVWT